MESERDGVGGEGEEQSGNPRRHFIAPRFLGDYEDDLGCKWKDAHAIRFHDDGAVNFPYLPDGMWFLTQHRRWGLLKTEPDYLAVASKVNRIDLYSPTKGRSSK